MQLIEFRKINTKDICDHYYNDGFAWSRIYEYPLVFNKIKQYYKEDYLIHNSSWGFEGVHILFKEKLDSFFNVEHSDIRFSGLKNTFVYNILEKNNSLKEKYNIVINISTLEEVNGNHLEVFHNLYDQIKNGGYIICTFDLPGLQLKSFEDLFNQKIYENEFSISGINSELKNIKCSNLNCGILIVRKTK